MAPLPSGYVVRAPKPITTQSFGLLDVIQPVTPSAPHWQASGVEWEEFLCTSGEVFLDNCPPATGFTKSAQRDFEFCHADPFTVVGSYDCPPAGRQVGDAFEIARQRLLAWEGHDVEEAFWTGLAANGTINPSLQGGNDTCDILVEDLTPVAGALDPVSGVAVLENALASVVPYPGVIHVPHGLAVYLDAFDLLHERNGIFHSVTGSAFVIGSGYPGSGPANTQAPADTTWIFGTGPVGVWRSNVYQVPDNISQAVDRQINDVTVLAERVYAVGYSCAVFAVNVTLCDAC